MDCSGITEVSFSSPPLHVDIESAANSLRIPGPGIKELEPFWPEGSCLQLQYSQLVILICNNVLWPHVTVGTLTLSAG
jgi:hypothetical protein